MNEITLKIAICFCVFITAHIVSIQLWSRCCYELFMCALSNKFVILLWGRACAFHTTSTFMYCVHYIPLRAQRLYITMWLRGMRFHPHSQASSCRHVLGLVYMPICIANPRTRDPVSALHVLVHKNELISVSSMLPVLLLPRIQCSTPLHMHLLIWMDASMNSTYMVYVTASRFRQHTTQCVL